MLLSNINLFENSVDTCSMDEIEASDIDIQNISAGKILNSLTGYPAFIPNCLPPKIEWNTAVVNSLSRADFLLGKLSCEGSKLPNPQLFIRSFIIEDVISSKIKGTQATLGEILAAHAGAHVKQNPNDLQEVQTYIKALDYGLGRLAEFPLSLNLIKAIHGNLMQGVRGFHATPGEFRCSQN